MDKMTASSPVPSLLDELRRRGLVDCDTMDIEVAKEFGPFVNCTSNQAIAYMELSKTSEGRLVHETLIKEAVSWTRNAAATEPPADGASVEALAVDYLVAFLHTPETGLLCSNDSQMAKLLIRFIPHLTGYVLFQINPKLAYDTSRTIAAAERVLSMIQRTDPNCDARRICFKILSTWQGLAACRVLQEQGITTLATAVFCIEQASLAGHAGCKFIAPYINELRVHFDRDFCDDYKAFPLCQEARKYFESRDFKTSVMAASFTTADEVMELAGLDYLTISPPIIRELASSPLTSIADSKSIGKHATSTLRADLTEPLWRECDALAQDREAWRQKVAQSDGGHSQRKLGEAVSLFSKMQDDLEALVRRVASG